MPARSRFAAAATAALLAVPSLAACSGDEPDAATGPGARGGARRGLRHAGGDRAASSSSCAPARSPRASPASRRRRASITSAPAFDGLLTVVFAGQTVDVPVIAVDDKVYAQLPFTNGAWDTVNPKEYGAPDPTDLIGADGFPALLTLTESPEAGESVRGGSDNSEVLTTYSGTVPGDAMDAIIPSSAGDSFDVEWQVNDDGELTQGHHGGGLLPPHRPDDLHGRVQPTTAPARTSRPRAKP